MSDPSFGTMIRATRLGWGLSRQHGCFIRMTDLDRQRSLIELCPVHDVPIKKTEGRYHRVWWDEPSILDLIPWLRGVKEIKRYIRVIVDDEGRIVSE